MSSFLALVLLAAQEREISDPLPPAPRVEHVGSPATGFRGVWYANQPSGDEYVYKYSGGLGTYCAKHQPVAIHVPSQVDRTFFCYGGTTEGRATRSSTTWSPTSTTRRAWCPAPPILLDKKTSDAHDNPVLAIDDRGTPVGLLHVPRAGPSVLRAPQRPKPHDVSAFERGGPGLRAPTPEGTTVAARRTSPTCRRGTSPVEGFACFFTRYAGPRGADEPCSCSSKDGRELVSAGSAWRPSSWGTTQISAVRERQGGLPCSTTTPRARG